MVFESAVAGERGPEARGCGKLKRRWRGSDGRWLGRGPENRAVSGRPRRLGPGSNDGGGAADGLALQAGGADGSDQGGSASCGKGGWAAAGRSRAGSDLQKRCGPGGQIRT